MRDGMSKSERSSEPDPVGAGLLLDVHASLEAHRITAEDRREHHRRARERCAKLVYRLGIPAGALGIAAVSTALTGVSTAITAGIALASAALAAALTVVAPVEGRMDHGRKEADYADLCRHIRLTSITLARRTENEQVEILAAVNRKLYRLELRDPIRSPLGPTGSERVDVARQLAQLSELHRDGALTKDEFSCAKRQLLRDA
jgi:hypothetical protein